MSSSIRRLSLALAVALSLCAAPAARAQDEQQQQPKQTAQAAPAPPQDDSVTEKGFRSKIIELKHRDPNALYSVVRPLGSGFRGSTITFNRDLRLLTVRDFPENIATIEEALRRLDTPEPARPDIEFRVHILIAANNPQTPPARADDYPAELNDVIKQLRTTLNYKSYYMMSSQVLRSKEGPGGLGNKGVAEFKLAPDTAGREHPIFYEYRVNHISLEATAPSGWKVNIGNFNFSIRIPVIVGAGNNLQYENVGFNTPVSMREGEKVVVGTTSMQDKGIVIVLVANVIK
jgi:hypothetical protein